MGIVGLGWDLWGWDGDPWGWDGNCRIGMEIHGLGWDLWGWDGICRAGMGDPMGLGWDLCSWNGNCGPGVDSHGTGMEVHGARIYVAGMGTVGQGWGIHGAGVGSVGLGHNSMGLSGCDLLSDGSVRGSQRLGYDGRDFISFELGSKSFVAADDAAEITRRHWEDENEVERQENNLKHVCPEWLRKYVRYGQKELERKVAPDVHVSGKEEHGTLILSCHVYGFYPNIITVNWMKGGEIWDQETEWGGIVPNSDGTFHTWARIEALPEEWEQYRCRVEHPGMLEPGIFAWGEKSGFLLQCPAVPLWEPGVGVGTSGTGMGTSGTGMGTLGTGMGALGVGMGTAGMGMGTPGTGDPRSRVRTPGLGWGHQEQV
uniref:Class I histocompatibility antigen, F10 alpha chain-like n=1 Tax=Cyanistes caeruleus TaxID=156563 RepID=A0A8C0UFB9_CYACU